MTKREYLEFFLIAKLLSYEDGYVTYTKCKDFLLSDMFKSKKNKWIFDVIFEIYGSGVTKVDDEIVVMYLDGQNKVPKEKLGNIACYLVEIYIQFCNLTRPLTGVAWTVEEAMDELIKLSDIDIWQNKA